MNYGNRAGTQERDRLEALRPPAGFILFGRDGARLPIPPPPPPKEGRGDLTEGREPASGIVRVREPKVPREPKPPKPPKPRKRRLLDPRIPRLDLERALQEAALRLAQARVAHVGAANAAATAAEIRTCEARVTRAINRLNVYDYDAGHSENTRRGEHQPRRRKGVPKPPAPPRVVPPYVPPPPVPTQFKRPVGRIGSFGALLVASGLVK